MTNPDTTTCSPERHCGCCHPEFIGQRCTIDYLQPGIILVTGSMGSGELRIDVSGPVPTVNGVRLASSHVLGRLGGTFSTLATQRSGLERPDETLTDAIEQFPSGCSVEHVGSGRRGTVEADTSLGWAHTTNVYDSVKVRVRLRNGSVAWFRPGELRRTNAPADVRV